MKRYMLIAVILALCVLTGCRSGSANETSTAGTTSATRTTTMPDMEEMLPGPEDTIDPSNGANEPDHNNSTTDSGIGNDTVGSDPTDETVDNNSRIRPRSRTMP